MEALLPDQREVLAGIDHRSIDGLGLVQILCKECGIEVGHVFDPGVEIDGQLHAAAFASTGTEVGAIAQIYQRNPTAQRLLRGPLTEQVAEPPPLSATPLRQKSGIAWDLAKYVLLEGGRSIPATLPAWCRHRAHDVAVDSWELRQKVNAARNAHVVQRVRAKSVRTT